MRINGIVEWPITNKEDEDALIKVLHSKKWWKNKGIYVKKFEKEFSNYHQCNNGVAVSNGTVALEIALRALGIKENDEVIIPDFTFFSTASAVLAVGAIPVMVDVLDSTFCIDPKQIRKAITKKTKAIIVVHLAGQIADMNSINKIAKENHLYVIEDAAHAHGAVWNSQKAGSFGDIGTFSFQNAKLLTAGEGGMLVSNNEKILDKIILLTNCGRKENDTSYKHTLWGTNARMSEFQGALLRTQFEKMKDQIEIRSENYKYFEKEIQKIPGVVLQKSDAFTNMHSHYMIMFYYNSVEYLGINIDEFVMRLCEAGIPATRAYEPLHNLPVFKTMSNKKWRWYFTDQNTCSNSEKIRENVVCLPHYILLSDIRVIMQIVSIIKKICS